MYKHVKNSTRKLSEEILSSCVNTLCYNIEKCIRAEDVTPQEKAELIIFSGKLASKIYSACRPTTNNIGNFTFDWIEVKEDK